MKSRFSVLTLLLVLSVAGCKSSSKCEAQSCEKQDAAVADLASADAGCSTYAFQFDRDRACIQDTVMIPVCFLGAEGGKGGVTVCIISPEDQIYFREEGNDQTPHSEIAGWRFRVSSGGSSVATDGSMLTAADVAACDKILGQVGSCNNCDDLGCH